MKTLDAELLNALTTSDAAPCLSIYLPLHSSVADSNLDALALKNSIKEIRSKTDGAHEPILDGLLHPVESLLNSKEFVREGDGTLAIFSSEKLFETIFLPISIPNVCYMDACFYVLPLFEFAKQNRTFQVLALGKNHVKLFEGNRYHFEEIALDTDIPTTMKAALGHDLTDNHLHAAAGGSAAIHGYMEITEERETDNTRFFRRIDQEIKERYSKQYKLPLYLASLPENQSLFQSLSRNECLQKEYLSLNAEHTDKTRLHQSALDLIDRQRQLALDNDVERLARAKAESLASEDVVDIAQHALDSRIASLFVTEGLNLAGTISLENRQINPDDSSLADIINRIALIAYRNGGQVHTLPQNNDVLSTGIASLNRF
ncbi:baeRF3 domain-containing protein [Sphingobacterium griseoflavum]|uniref:Uncharacterized protein n=1 Tax=Sphingobacterium griseoflavum TaxID=1474952 RepID=A0ABQ3HYE7_9SPHI|nr:hypothetical protein [Sphingobacterium griseoflavum]GHE35432.1 hypothetical protein GCM10017764_18400 [Sphingobacterium griseoflavum]